MSLTIAILNVNGLNNHLKRRTVFNYCKNLNYDVFFLQETHSTISNAVHWEMEWGGKCIWAHGSSNSKGLAILFNKNNHNMTVEGQLHDNQGRFQIVKVKISSKLLTLCNVYGPNKDNPQFFLDFFAELNNFSSEDKIIGGDFNIVLDNKLDKVNGPKHSNQNAQEAVLTHMKKLGLHDIFRAIHPSKKSFSRFQSNPFTATRIDFFLISKNLIQYTKQCKYLPAVKTDHKLGLIEIALNVPPHSKEYRKMNVSLLENELFVRQTKTAIYDYLINNPIGSVNPHVRWEALKCVIRGHIIKLSSDRKQISRN